MTNSNRLRKERFLKRQSYCTDPLSKAKVLTKSIALRALGIQSRGTLFIMMKNEVSHSSSGEWLIQIFHLVVTRKSLSVSEPFIDR